MPDEKFRLYGASDAKDATATTFAHEQRTRFYLFLLFVAAIVFVLMRENLNLSSELQSANSRLEEKQQTIDKLNSEAAAAQTVTAPADAQPSAPKPTPAKTRRKKPRITSQDTVRAIDSLPSELTLAPFDTGKNYNE